MFFSFSGAHPSRPFTLSSLHDPLQSCCLRHISTVSSDLHYSVVPKLKFNFLVDPWTWIAESRFVIFSRYTPNPFHLSAVCLVLLGSVAFFRKPVLCNDDFRYQIKSAGIKINTIAMHSQKLFQSVWGKLKWIRGHGDVFGRWR